MREAAMSRAAHSQESVPPPLSPAPDLNPVANEPVAQPTLTEDDWFAAAISGPIGWAVFLAIVAGILGGISGGIVAGVGGGQAGGVERMVEGIVSGTISGTIAGTLAGCWVGRFSKVGRDRPRGGVDGHDASGR
jgi:hypothetical protein